MHVLLQHSDLECLQSMGLCVLLWLWLAVVAAGWSCELRGAVSRGVGWLGPGRKMGVGCWGGRGADTCWICVARNERLPWGFSC